MAGNTYSVGLLVRNPRKPEWGPGKIVRVDRGALLVVFREVPGREPKRMIPSVVPLERCEVQHDPLLDNLPPLIEVKGKLVLPAARMTLRQAEQEFRARYPLGFEDPTYKSCERDYKWAAHEYFDEKLGGDRFRELLVSDAHALVVEIKRCVSKVNLLSPQFEMSAFNDAMKDVSLVMPFLNCLGDLLAADAVTEDTYTPYVKALGMLPAERSRVATWPVATIIPFLAQPDLHMFLKPAVTQEAAEALGFHLNYRAEPNWLTYSRLLEMARIYRSELAAWKPQDMIDVQSFFWVACGGYKSTGI